MGLDMYLQARRYVGGWEFSKDAERIMFKALLDISEFPTGTVAAGSPHAEIEVCAGYWRKANQIHAWFVANVQKGEDECKPHYVSRDQLKALRAKCDEALKTKNAELLPPQSGFFFGSTDVDEYYWADLTETIEIIDKALALPECWSFSYRSSW